MVPQVSYVYTLTDDKIQILSRLTPEWYAVYLSSLPSILSGIKSPRIFFLAPSPLSDSLRFYRPNFSAISFTPILFTEDFFVFRASL